MDMRACLRAGCSIQWCEHMLEGMPLCHGALWLACCWAPCMRSNQMLESADFLLAETTRSAVYNHLSHSTCIPF